MPRLGKSIREGKTSYNIQIYTRSYPFLKELFDVFYVKRLETTTFIDDLYALNFKPKEVNFTYKKKIKVFKIIPKEMFYWLNPISLAYWAMDDQGNTSSGSGFYLHTKGFDFYSVYFLVGIIHYKFDNFCTVQNHKNRPVIYIKSKSQNKFIEIVQPFFHESLLYKLK